MQARRAYTLGMFSTIQPRIKNWPSVRTGCAVAGLFSLFISSAISADILQPIPPQELMAGDTLVYPLEWQNNSGRRVQIKLGNAPADARLTVSASGQMVVVWESPPSKAADVLIAVVASDIDSKQILQTEPMVVRLAGSTDLSGTLVQPDIDDSAAKLVDKKNTLDFATPVLQLIPNQVVSAGRTVSMLVIASIPDGSPAELQVDRLPSNASFDANPDGSRTFFWQPGDRDQGEHLYLFTAINANVISQRSEQEVLIVVGDPSMKKTYPAGHVSTSE